MSLSHFETAKPMKLLIVVVMGLLLVNALEGFALYQTQQRESAIQQREALDHRLILAVNATLSKEVGLQNCVIIGTPRLATVNYTSSLVLVAYVGGVGAVPLLCPRNP